jgi:hypothetical protein
MNGEVLDFLLLTIKVTSSFTIHFDQRDVSRLTALNGGLPPLHFTDPSMIGLKSRAVPSQARCKCSFPTRIKRGLSDSGGIKLRGAREKGHLNLPPLTLAFGEWRRSK